MDLDEHLLAIEKLFSPKLFIIGGGVSKRSERFIPRLTVRAAVVPAKLLNDAGHRRGGDRGGRDRGAPRGLIAIAVAAGLSLPGASSDPDHGGTCRPCPS